MTNVVASNFLPTVSSMEMTPRASIGLPPMPLSFSHELVILPSKLLEDGMRHQIDDSVAVDEHPKDWLPIDVTPNVQWLQVLA
jgi:hypothetical protein